LINNSSDLHISVFLFCPPVDRSSPFLPFLSRLHLFSSSLLLVLLLLFLFRRRGGEERLDLDLENSRQTRRSTPNSSIPSFTPSLQVRVRGEGGEENTRKRNEGGVNVEGGELSLPSHHHSSLVETPNELYFLDPSPSSSSSPLPLPPPSSGVTSSSSSVLTFQSPNSVSSVSSSSPVTSSSSSSHSNDFYYTGDHFMTGIGSLLFSPLLLSYNPLSPPPPSPLSLSCSSFTCSLLVSPIPFFSQNHH
jgi:hypothetical protein